MSSTPPHLVLICFDCKSGPFTALVQRCPACTSERLIHSQEDGYTNTSSYDQKISPPATQPHPFRYSGISSNFNNPILGINSRGSPSTRKSRQVALAGYLSDGEHPWNPLESSVRPDIARIWQQTFDDDINRRHRRHLTEKGRIRANIVRGVGACPKCRQAHRKCEHVALDELVTHDLPSSGATSYTGLGERLDNGMIAESLIPPANWGVSPNQHPDKLPQDYRGHPQLSSNIILHRAPDPRLTTEQNWKKIKKLDDLRIQGGNVSSRRQDFEKESGALYHETPQYRKVGSEGKRKEQSYGGNSIRRQKVAHLYRNNDRAFAVNNGPDGRSADPQYNSPIYTDTISAQYGGFGFRHLRAVLESRSTMSIRAPAGNFYAPYEAPPISQVGYNPCQQLYLDTYPSTSPQPATTGLNNALQPTLINWGRGTNLPSDQLFGITHQQYSGHSSFNEALQQSQQPLYGHMLQESVSLMPQSLNTPGTNLEASSNPGTLMPASSLYPSVFTPSFTASTNSVNDSSVAEMEAYVRNSDFSQLEKHVKDVRLDKQCKDS